MIITSSSNPKVKNIITLKNKSKDQVFVEGKNIIEELAKLSILDEIYTTDSNYKIDNIPVTIISSNVEQKIKYSKTGKSYYGIASKKVKTCASPNKILVLDDVQDPSNVGAIIRTAAAFAIDLVMVTPKTASIWNHKVMSASQGNLWKVAIEPFSLSKIKKLNIPIITLDGHRETTVSQEYSKFALVCGNEGNGVSKKIITESDANLKIKIASDVESLNVGHAVAIGLYKLTK